MKRSKLIELLNSVAPADQDPEVITYNDIEEGYGTTNRVQLEKAGSEDLPYAKGDVPELKEDTILISG